MKIIAFMLMLLSAVTMFAEAVPANNNMFINGDFSEGLKGWRFENKAIAVIPDMKFNGKAVVKLPANSEIRQNFTIKPDTDYILTYYIKAENVKSPAPRNKGIRFMLNANKKWLRATPLAHGGCVTGTTDWLKGEFRFNSTKELNGGGKLTIKLVLDCEGVCYVSDVRLQEVTAQK